MNKEHVLALVRERKLMIAPDALDHVVEHANAQEILDKALESPGPGVL